MINELNNNFAKLIQNYLVESSKLTNEKTIDISEDFIANKLKLVSTILEYYVNGILYQNNITLDNDELKKLRDGYEKLIESYLSLIVSMSNNNLRLNETMLDELLQESTFNNLIEGTNHNNVELLDEFYDIINKKLEEIVEDIIRYERDSIRQRLIEANDPSRVDNITNAYAIEKFLDNLLFGPVNKIAIEEYLQKNEDDEIFESTLIKQLSRLYDNYKENLKRFSQIFSETLF
jgi:hypothetical protein